MCCGNRSLSSVEEKEERKTKKRLQSAMSGSGEAVKVIVRCRPMNSREKAIRCKCVVEMNSEKCSCSLVNPYDSSAPAKVFTFDGVYNELSTTEQIYNEIAYSLIESVLDGYNSTIFAYGQTGCGKSFSMQGVPEPSSQRGIIPRAFEHIFEAISLARELKYLVLASYLEIYNEEIRDLLGVDTKKKLELKESPDLGVYVHDLTHHAVHNVNECQGLMEKGWRNRAVGATLMNADSSRSHSIFTISIEMMPITESLDISSIRRGKLNLVDLAGSERQTKTGATGDRLKEATKINLSLSALGNVISALVDGKAKHIPYRDSKLTRLLQDSLGGNTKTLMVACLSPADNNYDETLSTLRYANRAKNICNKPHINEDPKDTMLREYQDEIKNLKLLLERMQINSTPDTDKSSHPDHPAKNDKNMEEYGEQMEKLKHQYEQERISKCKMETDLLALKMRLEEEMKKSNEKMNETNNADFISSTGVPVSNFESNLGKSSSAQQEIIKRLEKLQASMVGGERANDGELRERRLRKKREAERRLNTLAKIFSKTDNEEAPHLVLKVYDDIQEELKVKTNLLRTYKQKVKALERETQDLQSEFENERTDYLETIRRLERQLLLHKQILDQLMPALSKECNYSNMEEIKKEAKWSEDDQNWHLPSLINARIKFPPTTGWNIPFSTHNTYNKNDVIRWTRRHSGSSSDGWNCSASGSSRKSIDHSNLSSSSSSSSSSPSSTASSTELPTNRKFSLDQRFDHFDMENFAGNYFKPRRATELLLQARENAAKSVNKWKETVQQYKLQPKSEASEQTNIEMIPTIKPKISSVDNYSVNLRARPSWQGQASPITWMTGNVRVSPEMLPKKQNKIDLLPLIQEKKNNSL